MTWWFGRMLTFEVVADDGAVPLSLLLEDVSEGVINAAVERPIAGFASHGSSIRDSVAGLIDLCGVELTEQAGSLTTPEAVPPTLLAKTEMGCDVGNDAPPRAERLRAAEAAQPSAISMTYYDSGRDYQTGQVRSASGIGGARDERVELPAVLTATEARQLVEQALARRWRGGERLRLRLPPSRMDLRPGSAIQMAGSGRAWVIRSVSIEGMAVEIDAEAAPVAVSALPADAGRAVTEPDTPIGRTELGVFELPGLSDTPDALVKAFVAASNSGQWKTVPVEMSLGSTPLSGLFLTRRAVLGVAETVLDARAPLILDELSTVLVRLSNPAHYLLNADMDALMGGANLAVVGNELIQFGRAEQQGPGLYRLSRLLRGRRGTEWAAMTHLVGDQFCLIDSAAIWPVEMAASAVGATLTATAHGVGDVAPLPTVPRLISGESMRPPSPCHIQLARIGPSLVATWTRRSHRGWSWVDGVDTSDDSFPERYRLTMTGPEGQAISEADTATASFAVAQLPGQTGDTLVLTVATIGPLALSREVSASIII